MAAGLPEPDEATALTLFRILQEGTTNALRHARADRVDIRLWTDPAHWRMVLADDGVGMAPDRREGTGLTGMRERITLLGGTLRLEAGRRHAPDRGPAPAGRTALTTASTEDRTTPVTKRALVIDDHPITHLGASRLLRDLGYDPVGQAMSGEEALDQLTRDPAPDLIVLDISLPGAGGLDLVAPLLAAAPDARILVFSMNDQTALPPVPCRRARRGSCPRTPRRPISATPCARWRPESSIWPPSRRWRWPRCARAPRATPWARCRTANARSWP